MHTYVALTQQKKHTDCLCSYWLGLTECQVYSHDVEENEVCNRHREKERHLDKELLIIS